MAEVKTQGTDAFILVPSKTVPGSMEIIDLGCVTSIDPGSDSSDQIETTCLSNRTTRTYVTGLTTPGAGSFGLNADPQNPAHLRLFELSKSKENFKIAIGWSDGTTDPTLASSGTDFNLPTTRTFLEFEGSVSGFPFTFAQNALVTSTVAIQRSGEMFWYPKEP